MAFIGEMAALLAAACWTGTSTFFTLAGRRVGSVIVNRTRLLLALGMTLLGHWVITGDILPALNEPDRWFWFGLSGFIGFTLGDAFLFQAFVMIGARLSMLLMSLAPALATLIAWIFLKESLTLMQLFAMGLTIAGISWVVLERGAPKERVPQGVLPAVPHRKMRGAYLSGILFGIGGAIGQAVGLIFSKIGLAGDFSPISGNLIRLVIAAGAIWLFTIVRGQAKDNFTQLVKKPLAIRDIFIGTLFGPVVGVTLSLVAVQKTQVGIASTIMALPPVFILPISYFFFKERFTWQAIAGTVLAISGVGLLFLV